MILEFPPVQNADKNGLLAIGGDLEVGSLLLAYRSGIFPWPFDEETLAWFSPPQRAILFFDNFHISRSLEKARNKTTFTFSIDGDFKGVMRHCAELKNRSRQHGTWITPDVIESYYKLHKEGCAHSFECYDGEELVGGVYGVSIGKMFAAESMFYRRPNASKFALCNLIDYLKLQGATWIDVQVLNPFTQKLGAIDVPRREFMKLLKVATGGKETLFPKTASLKA